MPNHSKLPRFPGHQTWWLLRIPAAQLVPLPRQLLPPGWIRYGREMRVLNLPYQTSLTHAFKPLTQNTIIASMSFMWTVMPHPRCQALSPGDSSMEILTPALLFHVLPGKRCPACNRMLPSAVRLMTACNGQPRRNNAPTLRHTSSKRPENQGRRYFATASVRD